MTDSVTEGVLTVIKSLSCAAVLVGIGSTVCGALTLVYADPIWEFPFTTASGLWTGITGLVLGLVGVVLTRTYDHDRPTSSTKWVNIFRGFGQTCFVTGSMHIIFSIVGVATCASRSTRDDGLEKCNSSEHDSLLILQSLGVVFGVFIIVCGVGGVFYLLTGKRAATLLGDPHYGECGVCCY